MDRVIVYVDDAAFAQQMLAGIRGQGTSSPTHWVLVACAPRMKRPRSFQACRPPGSAQLARLGTQCLDELAQGIIRSPFRGQ